MKYLPYIAVILVVTFFYLLFVNDTKLPVSGSFPEQLNKTTTAQDKWETRSDEQSPVTIKVTPVEFGQNFKTWKFSVSFDTHSGTLDEDLTKTIVLLDGNNNIYKPTVWEGSGPGGHHREGFLSFNSIEPLPKYVELKFENIGGIALRSFRWEI